MFLLKEIDTIKLKKEGLIFIEIDLLMETFCVNVTELFLTYLFLIMLWNTRLWTPVFADKVDQRHGFLSRFLFDCMKVTILCNPLNQAQHL